MSSSSDDEISATIARIQNSTTHYETLGVEKDCEEKVLKKAYRKLALQLHPDKCQGSEEAFQKVSNAYSCLSQAESRAHYDRFGSEANGGVDPNELLREFLRENPDFAAGFGGQESFEEAKNDRNAKPQSAATESPAKNGRCCSNYCTNWFSIQEGEKTLDVPASFGPTSWQARLIKFGMMVWFCGSLIYKWYTRREYAAFFLAFLTHWGMIFASLWLVLTFFNSMFPPEQPAKPSDPVSLRIKLSWLLFTVACEFTVVIVLLYWILDYKPGVSPMDYINIFTHGLVVLIWPVGLVVDRYPIRWQHLPVPMVCASLYVAWLIIHQLCTDIGVPTRSDNDPTTNDDLIYTAVDFETKTGFSTLLVILLVFVGVPLVHGLLWGLSMYSCPCTYKGHNRRYLPEPCLPSSSEGNNNSLSKPTSHGSSEATMLDNPNQVSSTSRMSNSPNGDEEDP